MNHTNLERLLRLTAEGDAAAASELRRHIDRIAPPPAPPPPLNMQAVALMRRLVHEAILTEGYARPLARPLIGPEPDSEAHLPVPGEDGSVWAWVALGCGGLRLEYRMCDGQRDGRQTLVLLRSDPVQPCADQTPEDLIARSCAAAGGAAVQAGAPDLPGSVAMYALGLIPIGNGRRRNALPDLLADGIRRATNHRVRDWLRFPGGGA